MNKFVHTLLQALAVGVQLVNIGAVPAKYQPFVMATVALIQAGLAIYNHGTESSTSNTGIGGAGKKLPLAILAAVLFYSFTPAYAQTPASVPQPSAFPSTTYNFNLTPITLPGTKASIGGAEVDMKIGLTPNFQAGETSLIGADYSFIGGRGDYTIPQFSKWLQNASPTLNGYQFQLGITASAGVIRSPIALGTSQSHWGERAGMFLNYAVSGTTGLGIEAQWCNFPGYANSTYSLAFGPNFHF